MEATELERQTYDDFVRAFRAYKKKKREWQEKMELKLAKEEEDIRLKRKTLYAEYEQA